MALALGGVVAVLVAGGAATQPTGAWVAVLAVVSLLCLMAAELFGRRPLDCGDLAALAASYRNRFFIRAAFSNAIALFAFVTTFIVGKWWIYPLFLPFALYGLRRSAPTAGLLSAEQARLRLAGCDLSLIRALRTSPS